MLSLLRNEGSRLVLLCAGIWAITSIFDKIGVQLSSPVVYLTGMYAITAFLLTLIVFGQKHHRLTIAQSWKLVPIGLTSGAAHLTQMYALTLALVSYVIAVKSTNVFFNIAWGFLFFKERRLLQRLFGSLITIVGVLLLLFLG